MDIEQTGYLSQDVLFDSLRSNGMSASLRDLLTSSGMSDQTLRCIEADDFDVDFQIPILEAPYTVNSSSKLPITSAAMDTVTDSTVAMIMAEHGGRGTLPDHLTPEQQYKELARVKKRLQGFIEEPRTLTPDDTFTKVHEITERKGFDTIPILDGGGRLDGLVTSHEVRFSTGQNQPLRDGMRPFDKLVVVEGLIGIRQAYEVMRRNGGISALPLIDGDRKLIGLYTWKDAKRIVEDNSGFRNVDDNDSYVCDIAVPTDSSAFERLELCYPLLENRGGVPVIDTANGNGFFAFKIIRQLVKKYPDIDFMGGNTINPNTALRLAEVGVRGIKVGQASGRVCKTKEVTGVGRGQATAVHWVSRALRKSEKFAHIPVCSDGGVKELGDPAVALALGASHVMVGTAIGVTSEAPGKRSEDSSGNETKEVRGMGSEEAWDESDIFISRYDGDPERKPVAEGRAQQMLVLGSLADLLKAYRKATERAMMYVGATDLKSLQEKALFEYYPEAR